MVRQRSNCTPFTELSLEKIEKERAREFIWENQRRKDMIRFGSYFTRRHFMPTATPSSGGVSTHPGTADQRQPQPGTEPQLLRSNADGAAICRPIDKHSYQHHYRL
jgi:hypothetical protein